MSRLQFRILLVAAMTIGLLGGSFDMLFPHAVPEPLAMASNLYEATVPVPGWVTWLTVIGAVGNLAACAGLFLFRRWAPGAALVFTGWSIVLTSLVGASVMSRGALALTDLSSILWGVVLAAAYGPPLRSQFQGTAR